MGRFKFENPKTVETQKPKEPKDPRRFTTVDQRLCKGLQYGLSF